MRKKISILLLSGITIMPAVMFAQDSLKTEVLKEVVVTGTKFSLPTEKSGKVIFKIGSDQLQTGRNLSDALNEIPGIQMDGNFSTPGTNISYYVRGGRSKQTLILLDGVPMNDPSGIDPYYDLRFLATGQVGNVEILQGGLSTLYGTGASASVINIQTKNSELDGIHGGIDLNAGSYNSFGQNLNLNGRMGKVSFQLLGGNFTSTGFSAALDNDAASDFDDDGFERRNGLLKVGFQINPKLKLDLFGALDWFNADFDDGAFLDGNNSQEQIQKKIGVKGTWNYTKGYVTLTTQQTSLDRDISSGYPTEYKGQTWFGEVTHKHEINSNWTILDGVSFQRMSYDEKNQVSKDTTSFTIIDPYFSVLFGLPAGLNVHAGVRLNNHSDYGSNLIYNFNPSWTFTISQNASVKLFASAATSFITPTLFQLHYPYGGNINLLPEESFNTEYGATFTLSGKFNFTAVNYFREEKNVIGYTFQYENISKKRNVKGVTVDARYNLIDPIVVTGDFSWVTSDDKQSFFRIPARKAGLGVQFKPMKTSSISVHYQYTGERTDLYYDEFFNAIEVELAAYNLLDLSVSQSLLKNHLLLSGSILNVTDENFVGVYGYTTRGRNYLIGIKYNF